MRGARTPHCGGAHNAPLAPEGEGKGRARTRNFLLKSRNFVVPLDEKIRELNPLYYYLLPRVEGARAVARLEPLGGTAQERAGLPAPHDVPVA